MKTQHKKIYIKYLGSNDDSGKLIRILGPGTKIKPGDKLADIETTKTIIELESDDSGFFYPSNEVDVSVRVGQELGII